MSTVVYEVTAYTFFGAAAIAVLAYIVVSLFREPRPRTRMLLLSAAMVALITSAVAWVLFQGDVTGGAPVSTWLEWAGYTLSLYFIGSSLTSSLFVDDVHQHAAAAGRVAALTGLGGLLGCFLTSSASKVAVAIITGVVYVHFFVLVLTIDVKRRDGFGWVLALFAVVTAVCYVFPYIAGLPVAGWLSVEAEHWFYFAGNVLTKILLPLVEIFLLKKPRAEGQAEVQPWTEGKMAFPSSVRVSSYVTYKGKTP